MDCDRFERVMMDVLYDELDELSLAAATRHSDQCQRCKDLIARLRATREVGSLPLEEPPADFERRVMEAERQVQSHLPFTSRMSRQLIILAGYATRPQLAMAALALLMIGSSLLLLRPSPGPRSMIVQASDQRAPKKQPEAMVVPIEQAPPIELAEEEEPEAEPPATEARPELAKKAQPHEPRVGTAVAKPAAVPEEELDKARQRAEDRAYTAAMQAFQQADLLSAQKQFDAIVQAGGRNAAAAELYAALATEQASGCSAALPRFDSVSAKYGNNHLGHMATWHSASCRSKLGRVRRASLDFQKLLRVPAYSARAKAALSRVGSEIGDFSPAPSATVTAAPPPTTTAPPSASGQVPVGPSPTTTAPPQKAVTPTPATNGQ
jgi:hypothetical protein